jgi:DNA-binding transcriptional MerR regulator
MTTQPPITIEFNDGKAPDAMRTIGEVSAALDIRQHVLRYWEDQFPMLRPLKRSGGRRYYRPEDVQLIATIDRLVHRDGYTLRGARAAIEASSAGGRRNVKPQVAATEPDDASTSVRPDTLRQLHRMRNDLVAALLATA